jgi:hypothetical protein
MGRNNKDFISAIEAKDPFDRTRQERDMLRENAMFKAQDDYYKPDYRDTSKDN